MNIIVENLVKDIKSKAPNEWSASQLEDFYYDICSIYYYAVDKEDKDVLKRVFNRVIESHASKKANTALNPGKLEYFDKLHLKF